MKKFLVIIGLLIYRFFERIVTVWHQMLNAVNTGYQIAGMHKADYTVLIEHPTDKIHGKKYISLGKYVSFGKRAVITAWCIEGNNSPEIIVGDNTSIGDDCFLTSTNSIRIGSNVLLAQKVTITDNSHGMMKSRDELEKHPSFRTPYSKGPVIIEDNVWIGDKVSICPNVKIGRGAIIGANSVVTKDIPPYTVAVGSPAKIIKTI